MGETKTREDTMGGDTKEDGTQKKETQGGESDKGDIQGLDTEGGQEQNGGERVRLDLRYKKTPI